MSEVANLISFNLWCMAAEAGRSRQVAALEEAVAGLGDHPTLVALQEVTPNSLRPFEKANWDVLATTARKGVRLGVAVLGRKVRGTGSFSPEPARFERGDVYPELARWYSERAMVADVVVRSASFRFASLHATPGTSKGPGGRGVGGTRKPWFHRQVAEWMAEWEGRFAFGIDANTPSMERLDAVRFHIPAGSRTEAGEDHLLGVVGISGVEPLHGARDLLRAWLGGPGGASHAKQLTDDGPLWISHYTRSGKPKRYDHIWATPGIDPLEYRHWPLSRVRAKADPSDHAIVGTRVQLS